MDSLSSFQIGHEDCHGTEVVFEEASLMCSAISCLALDGWKYCRAGESRPRIQLRGSGEYPSRVVGLAPPLQVDHTTIIILTMDDPAR